jgi:hypothetical protein
MDKPSSARLVWGECLKHIWNITKITILLVLGLVVFMEVYGLLSMLTELLASAIVSGT